MCPGDELLLGLWWDCIWEESVARGPSPDPASLPALPPLSSAQGRFGGLGACGSC